MKTEITKEEATLILQMLAGAQADKAADDYVQTCIVMKSLYDKCVEMVNAEPLASAAKGKG